MAAKKVALIISSVRGVRVGPSVVDWVHKTLKTSSATPAPELSIVDIATFNLPAFNEKAMPAMVPDKAQFEFEHSKKWSAAIAPFDGYIFVSPEYNYGVPGAVKNAIDYLYNEWIGKPVLIITYGIQGATIASGNLKETLTGMKLRVVETRPQLKFAGPGQEEMFQAIGAGILGPKTVELWEAEQKETVLKGFEELTTLLHTPPPVVEPVKGA